MIQAKLSWNGPQAQKQVLAASWQALQRAVVYYHTKLLEALNVSNPRPYKMPSRLGEPPRKRTGYLQRNVLYELDEPALTARVGMSTNAKYGAYLEKGTKHLQRRPWLLATLDKFIHQTKALAEGG